MIPISRKFGIEGRNEMRVSTAYFMKDTNNNVLVR